MDLSTTVRVISSLAFVLILLVIFLFYLRKMKGIGLSKNTGGIKILEQTYLDATKRLVLVEAKNRVSLISISGDRIDHLWTIEKPQVNEIENSNP